MTPVEFLRILFMTTTAKLTMYLYYLQLVIGLQSKFINSEKKLTVTSLLHDITNIMLQMNSNHQ